MIIKKVRNIKKYTKKILFQITLLKQNQRKKSSEILFQITLLKRNLNPFTRNKILLFVTKLFEINFVFNYITKTKFRIICLKENFITCNKISKKYFTKKLFQITLLKRNLKLFPRNKILFSITLRKRNLDSQSQRKFYYV